MLAQVFRKYILALVACSLLFVAGQLLPSTAQAKDDDSTLIAVIPKGTTHEFWKAVHAGAVKAERELQEAGHDVSIVWQGPLREDDRNQQIQIVQANLTKGSDAIVLAPLDSRALRRPVMQANKRKVPVVIIDSDIEREGVELVSFVATDNREGGRRGGHHLAKLLGGKGNVVLLRYQVGSASTTAREEGFLEAIAEYPEIKVVSSNQYAGATREEALKKAGQMLATIEEPVDGFFSPNESTTFGMLLALDQRGLLGKVKVVGFDSSQKMLDATKDGEVHGIVVQNPFKMGYLGVMSAWDALQGKPVEPRIDTGCEIVVKDNLEEPNIKELIEPPLKEYLGE